MDSRGRCFVIQPFDGGGEFDKRYDDVFVPAIEAAGLAPYRVDRDTTAHIPIEAIERELRDSSAVLADITLDRPNVWYEVGFAFANAHPVVLVCRRDARARGFPFDIQHRLVTEYEADSPRDFGRLRKQVAARLQAVKSEERLARRLPVGPVTEHAGLQAHEIAALAMAAQHQLSDDVGTNEWAVRRAVVNAGFTELAFTLALRRLKGLELLAFESTVDERGNEYVVVRVRSEGFGWLEKNQDRLELRARGSG